MGCDGETRVQRQRQMTRCLSLLLWSCSFARDNHHLCLQLFVVVVVVVVALEDFEKKRRSQQDCCLNFHFSCSLVEPLVVVVAPVVEMEKSSSRQ